MLAHKASFELWHTKSMPMVRSWAHIFIPVTLPKLNARKNFSSPPGAGPYSCQIDTESRGQQFTNIPVSVNVPGDNSRSNSKSTDFTLEARMPQGTKCTGGSDGQTCILRCLNVGASPFQGEDVSFFSNSENLS